MSLKIERLSKVYESTERDAPPALTDIAIDVPTGAFLTLLGPSGCGKSTLLNMISGLDRPSSGMISIDGKVVYDSSSRVFLDPAERNISMVFQSYAIWPHMTVAGNIEFPLKYGTQRKILKAPEREKRVTDALDKVHMGAFRDRPAPLLSGGQQQRVSLARALAQRPSIILLDEPLSNLDASLREHMQKEIRTIVTQEGITAVYVTHDQKEALSMSDVIVLMKEGLIEQIGSAQEIYYRPRTRFVAKFMGSPNIIDAEVRDVLADKQQIVTQSALGTLYVQALPDVPVRQGDRIALVIKQEDVRLLPDDPAVSEDNTFTLDLRQMVFMGDRVELVLDLGEHSLSVYTNARRWKGGDRVRVGIDREDIHYVAE